jgi:hypothetical protein
LCACCLCDESCIFPNSERCVPHGVPPLRKYLECQMDPWRRSNVQHKCSQPSHSQHTTGSRACMLPNMPQCHSPQHRSLRHISLCLPARRNLRRWCKSNCFPSIPAQHFRRSSLHSRGRKRMPIHCCERARCMSHYWCDRFRYLTRAALENVSV